MDGSRFDDLTRQIGHGATRRRLLKGIGGGIAALLASGAASRGASARDLTICHATGDAEAPYETMSVSQAEFNLHARHGDFLRVECCADGDCTNLNGACGSGVCQDGYCVQLPLSAGTPCDSGLLCTENDWCDGAFNCVTGNAIVCDSADQCHASSCDPGTGNCVVDALIGAPCMTTDAEDGACDEQGDCLALACGEGPGCAAGELCINDACFRILTPETRQVCNTQPVPCMSLDATDPGYPGVEFCVYAIAMEEGHACQSNGECVAGEICVTITTSEGTYSRCTSQCP